MIDAHTARGLRWVMFAAAAYDLAFGLLIVLAPGSLAAVLHLALPGDLTYVRLVGVLLLVLGSLYVLPTRDPVRFAPVIGVSAAGRLLGFAYLLRAWSLGQPRAFLWLALADLAFGLVQAGLLLRQRTADQS